MCKKQTSASHSFKVSEIISLDAGLRMDGLSALDLWDIVIERLRSTNTMFSPNILATRKLEQFFDSKTKTQNVRRRQKCDQVFDVDNVPTNILVKVSLSCTFLKITKL